MGGAVRYRVTVRWPARIGTRRVMPGESAEVDAVIAAQLVECGALVGPPEPLADPASPPPRTSSPAPSPGAGAKPHKGGKKPAPRDPGAKGPVAKAGETER